MPVATASVLLRKGNTRDFGFPGGSAVKNPRAVQETLQTLGREDPLEKDMATHSSIFAWRIPWAEEPGGLHSKGCKESDMTE